MPKTGKKGAPIALQTHVNSEEEWQELLSRPGLILVDVYSEWSGPCAAMISALRKIKMEIAGDTISYAAARSDNIADLERFRGKSEPTWLFMENGKIVNCVFGADSPRLRQLLLQEIRRAQNDEPPKWNLDVAARTPDEETRWQSQRAIRQEAEAKKLAEEAAKRKEEYEAFMSQMTLELCEETALIFYPWVFRDEDGKPRDKHLSPPYTELAHEDLFRQYFDVLEETRIQLAEEKIEKMLLESNVEITEDLLAGLMDGKCMALRLKGRAPHSEWPVPYPHRCPEGIKKCPTRAIDDIENYLLAIINDKPVPLLTSTNDGSSPRTSYLGAYAKKHFYVHEPDPQVEGDTRRVYPAVWVPPNARCKVHVYKTLFPDYMNFAHPYEEPAVPPPLCAFKFLLSKFSALKKTYESYPEVVEYFGAFEYDDPPNARRIVSCPEDFETKVRRKTGSEIFVVIIKRINEPSFYAFAGIEPYFVTEDDEEAQRLAKIYFPDGAKDALLQILREDEDEPEEYDYVQQFQAEVEDVSYLEGDFTYSFY